MEITIKKWGNSAAVRIPAAILAAAHIGLDQAVDVREEQGRIDMSRCAARCTSWTNCWVVSPAKTCTSLPPQARRLARKPGNVRCFDAVINVIILNTCC